MALPELMSTGVPGFDKILGGGLPRKRIYLAQGEPGTGKTTLGLQFLLEGAKHGESALLITLSETKEEIYAVAESHGWSLDPVYIFEIIGTEDQLTAEEEYTAFHPAEVELGETVQTLLAEVDRVKPTRVVVDSLSEMRLLARDPLRYRRQIVALKHFFIERGCTVLFLDDPAHNVGEHQFQTLAHGVISFERLPPEYGRARRRIQICKLRGVEFHDGYHDCLISKGGVIVYPRLVSIGHQRTTPAEKVTSGVAELDELLAGGPERGTSALIVGAAGVGKTTLCVQYAVAAAHRGERTAIFSFDERLDTLLSRAEGTGLSLQKFLNDGDITAQQIDPAVLSPGEFIDRVRHCVEKQNARIVVIDSLNGYLHSMPGDRFLVVQMHELLTYLGEQGVLSLVVIPQHGLFGTGVQTPVDLSYLADNVLLIRYFEHAGRVRKAISAVKTRGGPHEDSIREYRIGANGVSVGAPLTQFQGILTGAPTYTGSATPLIGDDNESRDEPS
jgi:circadian clock protein KaiC